MEPDKPYDIAVGARIKNSVGETLLLKRASGSSWYPGAWELPGGKPNPGESVGQALCREVMEETGLRVCITCFAGATAFEHPKLHVVVVYFDCQSLHAGKICLSREHESFNWIAQSDFPAIDLTPPARDLLLSA